MSRKQFFFESAAVRKEVERRPGPVNQVARRDLARWYGMLSDEARALKFDDAELAAIAAAVRDAEFGPHNYRLLWAVAEAGLRGHHDGLAARIRALTPGQTWALIDLLERQGGTS